MEERIRQINDIPDRDGDCVVYWMQGAQRTHHNHTLEYAVLESNRLEVPLLVFFNIVDDYADANLRHYHFMIEGLLEVKKSLEEREIPFFLIRGNIVENVAGISQDASLLVTDKGYMKWQKHIRSQIAEAVLCPFKEVETNLVVPIELVSDKEEYAARTIRPKITRLLDDFLYDYEPAHYHQESTLPNKIIDFIRGRSIEGSSPEEICRKLTLAREINPSRYFKGGTSEALRRLDDFIDEALVDYERDSSDPSKDCVSRLSPYLHFGQISPQYIAQRVLRVRNRGNSSSIDDFLEELIVRRELAFNFVYYNEDYDKWEGITYPWAYDTLRIHSIDTREHIYSLEELEGCTTHDPYWNACMKEMVTTGYMHGYMRMYWCKKILEWSPDPEKAYRDAIYLNNKYFIDGRDPNSYTGVAWCFGKHDRGWKEREIYGKIRCMMASGLKRKFDMETYIEIVNNYGNLEEV